MRISLTQTIAGAAVIAVVAAAVLTAPARADDTTPQTRYAVAWMGTMQCGTTPTAHTCQQ